jgi:glucan phosphoethanolaminetransferase (alkaline phosphatase superfamily)
MNIEELKTEWKQYNQKLALSERLNERLIQSMLRERSRSRVSKIRRDSVILMVLMFINLIFFAAIFAGNPFDFRYTVQFVPYGLLTIGAVLAILSLVKTLRRFNMNMNTVNLHSFLTTTITEYEKNKKVESWFGIIICSGGLLTVFSFLPRKLENSGLWPALGETAISLLITITIYFVAFKLGAFKNRKKEGFENDLKELNEMKAIASEFKED